MDRAWWNQMTNARRFIEDAVTYVTAPSLKSVVLILPEGTPWPYTMREILEEKIKERNAKNSFEYIICPDEDPGKFLLDRFCRRETRAMYRPGKSFAEFLAQSDDIVLNDKYIWIKDIPAIRLTGWVDFITEYSQKMKKGNTPAVFILEIRDEEFFTSGRKYVMRHSYHDYVSSYDYFTHAAIIAGSVNGVSDKLKPYLAELSSSLNKDNVVAAGICAAAGEDFMTNPLAFMNENTGLPFGEPTESLQKLIWEVQLKTVYPRIENYRCSYIERRKADIEKCLPFYGPYGEYIEKAEDVEIGPLFFLCDSGKLEASSEEENLLYIMKTARNDLAHVDALTYETVKKILQV